MKMLAATFLAFASLSIAHAQTPAAPQGATGMCKDGSYSTAASKRGACAGHKGVKDWYAADATATTATTAAPAAPASASAGAPVPVSTPSAAATPSTKTATVPATTAASAPATKAPTVAAAGGGNGQVWVNTSTKVYHCEGDRYYGKTKAGSYMTESAALAAGDRAANGKACKAS